MMNSITWPEGYLPGFADNFVSNEVVVAGLVAKDVWPLLHVPTLWPSYYANSANVHFHGDAGPQLKLGDRFYFETFGFPVEAKVVELVEPSPDAPGRIAWHGWAGEGASRLDVHHAWLVEDIADSRVRVLTQETQLGAPAVDLAKTKPNPMINGHQDWLDGLIAAARQEAAVVRW